MRHLARFASVLFAVAACSGAAPETVQPTSGELTPPSSSACTQPMPGADYECVQDCGAPVAREGDPPRGWSWLSPDDAASRKRFGCPICLPSDAQIATPSGSVAVSKLSAGMRVISLDGAGRRIEAAVVFVSSVPVAASHEIVVIEFTDGRVVRASEGHPLASGELFGHVEPGERIDGIAVRSVRRERYTGERTWDLLVDSPTGLYLSEGVVLGSTLSNRVR